MVTATKLSSRENPTKGLLSAIWSSNLIIYLWRVPNGYLISSHSVAGLSDCEMWALGKTNYSSIELVFGFACLFWLNGGPIFYVFCWNGVNLFHCVKASAKKDGWLCRAWRRKMIDGSNIIRYYTLHQTHTLARQSLEIKIFFVRFCCWQKPERVGWSLNHILGLLEDSGRGGKDDHL